MNKRIFPRNKAVIFILNILLISIIVGLFSSIISGIGARQFYVNEDNNVVTIVNPNVKTPAVSYIPNTLENIFQGMKGVTAVSPEIYSLILINNKPATLHGITSNFTKLVNAKTIVGENFSNITDQELSLGIYAGISIAHELGLKVGNNYIIYSTISDSFVSFRLLGIESFSSFYNEELFTSLANSNYFRPASGKNDVSMIRIQYNQRILSSNTINDMINNKHQVTIQVFNPAYVNGPLNGIQINVVTKDGFFESTALTDGTGRSTFYLPLGDYIFLLSYGSTSVSIEKLIYNTTTIDYQLTNEYTPLSQGNYTLTVNTFNYGKKVTDANIVLINKYGNKRNLNFNNGFYLIDNVTAGNYTIKAMWNGHAETKDINIRSNTNIDLNFNNKVQMILKTISNSTLNTFSCNIYDYNNKTNINLNDCSQSFYLPKGVYNVSLIKNNYDILPQMIVVGNSSEIQQFLFMTGTIQTSFSIYTTFGVPYSNKPVYAKNITDSNFFLEGYTTSQGTITLDFPYNSEHILFFNTATTKNQIYYKSVTNEAKTIILNSEKKLTIYTYNGTLGQNYPLLGVKIVIKTFNNTIYSNTSLITGFSNFNIITENILNITLSLGQFSKTITLNSFPSGDILKLPLGNVHITISTQNDYGASVSNVAITYISNNGNQTYFTNNNGIADLYFDTQDSPSLLQSNIINSTTNIANNIPLSFLVQYYYVFNIKYNNISDLLVIPKTFLSTSIKEFVLTPYIYIVTFKLVNAYNSGISNAVLQLTSKKLGNSISLVTNSNGIATTLLPADGAYSISIYVNGNQFENNLILSLNKNSYTMQVFVFGSSININNNLGGPYTSLTSRQYQNNFYSTTTTIFIQLALILLLVVVIILIFLFSSAILLTFESIHKEIAVLQIIGGTNYQITWNLLAQLSLRTLGASILGYFLGFGTTIIFPSLKDVQLVGFIINPTFNPILFIISILIVNTLSTITLIRQLSHFNWKNPISNIRF